MIAPVGLGILPLLVPWIRVRLGQAESRPNFLSAETELAIGHDDAIDSH